MSSNFIIMKVFVGDSFVTSDHHDHAWRCALLLSNEDASLMLPSQAYHCSESVGVLWDFLVLRVAPHKARMNALLIHLRRKYVLPSYQARVDFVTWCGAFSDLPATLVITFSSSTNHEGNKRLFSQSKSPFTENVPADTSPPPPAGP